MMKFNFKKINWKEPKFIFPLIIFFPVLAIGYMMFGIIDDLSESEEDPSLLLETQQIADVPLGDSTTISSKSEAVLEEFMNQKDFTALQLSNEYTRLSTDTTIYTEEEKALLALQGADQFMAKSQEEELNRLIKEHNNSLEESRRSIGNGDGAFRQSSSESTLDKEIRMYQKILRGEEILTEEEEEERKINRIKQEERAKVLSELQQKDIVSVSKASNTSESAAFNTITKSQEESNNIRAMVDQGVKVTSGSRIRLRLLDDISLQGVTIPAGTHVYALVTEFGDQRVRAHVTSIVSKGRRVKVNLSVYDSDGIEGFFIPKSTFRDLSRNAGSQVLGQNNINFTQSAETMEGVALQALQGVYQSASNAISQKVKENKAKIKYNTTIYLINGNE